VAKKKVDDPRDQSVVATIGELTSKQAANIVRAIINSKDKYAPEARGTVAKGSIKDVGGLLAAGVSMIAGGVGKMLDTGSKSIKKLTAKGDSKNEKK